jgi:hypothetical protein
MQAPILTGFLRGLASGPRPFIPNGNGRSWLRVTVIGQRSGGASGFRKSVHSGRPDEPRRFSSRNQWSVPQQLSHPQPFRLPFVEIASADVRRKAGERQQPADAGKSPAP